MLRVFKLAIVTSIFSNVSCVNLSSVHYPESQDVINFVPFGHDGLTIRFSEGVIRELRSQGFRVVSDSKSANFTWRMTQSLRPVSKKNFSYRVEGEGASAHNLGVVEGICTTSNVNRCAREAAIRILRNSRLR